MTGARTPASSSTFVGRYVRKEKKYNNNMKGDKTGVVFWSAVYLFRLGLTGDF